MNKPVSITISTLLIFSGLLPAGAAAADTQTPATPSVQTLLDANKLLRVNFYSEPTTADPAMCEEELAAALLRATFDGLMRVGTDRKLHPSVAEKVEVSADLQTYTFTLRHSQWSNGDPVTAHDFEYAWKRVLDPRFGSNYAYLLYSIKNAQKANRGEVELTEVGVKALNDKVLQVTLESPTPFFPELTALPVYYPVNKNVAEANERWAFEAVTHVGNGPFVLKEWNHKESLLLVKNERYWDKDAVKLDGITVTMIEDENAELARFKSGELDWAGEPLSSLPQDALPQLKQEGKLHTQPIAGVYWYKFNTEQAPFQNAKIRKAFAYALDRQALLEEVGLDSMLPAFGAISPSMSPDAKAHFTDHDTALAKKLLAEGMKELGLSELPPITLTYNTSDGNKKIARVAQKQWKEALGVQVAVENLEWKVYLEKLHEGDFQLGRMGWLGDFNDPINFLELYQTKDGGNNDTNWENAKYRELLEKSNKEGNAEKRKQLLDEAESILLEEMPVIPIYFYTKTYLQKDNLKGVVIDGLGYIDWKWTSKE